MLMAPYGDQRLPPPGPPAMAESTESWRLVAALCLRRRRVSGFGQIWFQLLRFCSLQTRLRPAAAPPPPAAYARRDAYNRVRGASECVLGVCSRDWTNWQRSDGPTTPA